MNPRLCFISLFVMAACTGGERTPAVLAPLTAAPLVTESSVQLAHALGMSPLRTTEPAELNELLADGWGDTTQAAGVTVVAHTIDNSPAPSPGASRRMLSRFVHLADTQLLDDESPARVVQFDTPTITYASFRPQEAWICRMLNAAVRTINKVHQSMPLEFVVLGGDNADNAQTNEIDWFQSILGGSPNVACDSGTADDPVPGPNNDPKDPFVAEGLAMPWRWVTGNHDILNQGNFTIESQRSVYVGTDAPYGTREWSKADLPTTIGPIVADAKRDPLDRFDLMAKISADGDGHGITSEVTQTGKAFYSFDVTGGGLRIIALDTASETGSADGMMHRADMESRVRPMLEKAEADGVYVILVSHHSAPTFATGAGAGGTAQADAVLADEWRNFLGGFPHVMLHLGAHTHYFRSAVVQPASGHAYFEAESASLMDWPGQVRIFEIWDEDNGFIKIRAIPVDYSVEGDAVSAEGRRRAAADFAAGWVPQNDVGPGMVDARAVELYFPKAL